MSRPTQDTDRPSLDFAYGALTLSGAFSQTLLLSSEVPCLSPTTPADKSAGLGSFLFARRYLGNRYFFLFLQLLRCFSSLRVPSLAMYSLKDSMSAHAGFPHSETSGSKPTYGSPKTFAVSRVLHRLPVPRHSPCALLHLTLQVCSFELSRSLCNVFIDLNDSRFFLGIKIFSFQRTSES